MKKTKYKVKADRAKQRLDSFVSFVEKELTRSQAKLLITDGNIFINGKKAKKAGQIIEKNDLIEIKWPEEITGEIKAEKIDLDIIYEDKHLFVINKPAGMVVHPAPGHSSGTLLNAIVGYIGTKIRSVGGAGRVGLVHRLDKDTSGLILFAKNNKIHKELQKLFAERKVKKTYLVLIHGHIKPSKGLIDAPISRNIKDRKKMQVSNRDGAKEAKTHYQVEKDFQNTQLVKVNLETGRTHQIRIHFSSLGFPVVGDKKYGNPKVNTAFKRDFGLKRQFLHAHKLEFIHPQTKEKINIKADLPSKLNAVIKALEEQI